MGVMGGLQTSRIQSHVTTDIDSTYTASVTTTLCTKEVTATIASKKILL